MMAAVPSEASEKSTAESKAEDATPSPQWRDADEGVPPGGQQAMSYYAQQEKALDQHLNVYSSSEDKYLVLRSKYLQLKCENQRLENELGLCKRRCDQLQDDKDKLFLEANRAEAAKLKLENLCRELQRQARGEVARVKDDEVGQRIAAAPAPGGAAAPAAAGVTAAAGAVAPVERAGNAGSAPPADATGETEADLKEHQILRRRLRNYDERYQLREKHFYSQLRTKALEQKLMELRLETAEQEAQREHLRSLACQEYLARMVVSRNELRDQLGMYAEKFGQFQETVARSNEIFASFKQEMDRMGRTIKKLEKERNSLQRKCEQTDVALIDMVEERTTARHDIETLRKQNARLEQLCRVLQSERRKKGEGECNTHTAGEELSK